ncbi:MAG TPA: methylated-DNA--[protein]-cysteine S-methyltransferase [Bryobacteraceae bacterium]|jgi:AraC family transcriptional regulator of adaptative response/methylated-DNA-[protein]-cysteine methyltransferase|nr:methylated-DNA--[protein]-cysteine S-methyltransferase [Bryobacteraceae bacterium]
MPTVPTPTTRIQSVCDYIRTHSHEPLPLAQLAATAGLSPFHFQRTFKSIVGVTPKQFADSCRLEDLKGQLRAQPSVTGAIYQAGFNSGSRVYERSGSHLGMTPGQYRAGGAGASISWVIAETPIGRMMMAATDRGLCFIQFGDSDEALVAELRNEYPKAQIEPMREPYPRQFNLWMNALTRHLNGEQPAPDLPLDVRATAFQMKVWRYLQSIPAGTTQSYSEVAAGIGQPTAARAVARACATNPVSIVVPCHRVIRGSGDLAGYRWGLDRKRALLDREKNHAA